MARRARSLGLLAKVSSNFSLLNSSTFLLRDFCDTPAITSALVISAPAELHGKIYVIGGQYETETSSNDLKVVECYDPEKNDWESLPDMKVEKYSEAPAVGLNGQIFVGGGARDFDENNEEDEGYNLPLEYDHIENFVIRSSQWNLIEDEDDTPYIMNMFVMHRKYLPKDM